MQDATQHRPKESFRCRIWNWQLEKQYQHVISMLVLSSCQPHVNKLNEFLEQGGPLFQVEMFSLPPCRSSQSGLSVDQVLEYYTIFNQAWNNFGILTVVAEPPFPCCHTPKSQEYFCLPLSIFCFIVIFTLASGHFPLPSLCCTKQNGALDLSCRCVTAIHLQCHLWSRA